MYTIVIDWTEIARGIIIIVGVVVGAWATQSIGGSFERRKRKRIVKYNLIEAISSYYSYLSVFVTEANYHNLYARLRRDSFNLVLDASIPQDIKIREEIKFKNFETLFSIHRKDVKDAEDNVIQYEAKIRAILSEMADYYTKRVFELLFFKVDVYLSMSSTHKFTYLYDYENGSETLLRAISVSLPSDLTKKDEKIKERCGDMINEIQKILR